PYYLSWLAHMLFRLDVWDSYRAVGVVAALVGTAGVYLLTVALWRRVSLGLLAAVTLLYGPYFIPIDLFKRGDLAEAMGIALLPWLLLALWQLWQPHPRAATLGWLGLAAGAGAAPVLA